MLSACKCESERVSRRVCSCAIGQCECVCVRAFDPSLFEVLVLASASAGAPTTSTAASMLTNFNPEEQEFIFLLKSKR